MHEHDAVEDERYELRREEAILYEDMPLRSGTDTHTYAHDNVGRRSDGHRMQDAIPPLTMTSHALTLPAPDYCDDGDMLRPGSATGHGTGDVASTLLWRLGTGLGQRM